MNPTQKPQTWEEKVPFFVKNPKEASLPEIQRFAKELLEARNLLQMATAREIELETPNKISP